MFLRKMKLCLRHLSLRQLNETDLIELWQCTIRQTEQKNVDALEKGLRSCTLTEAIKKQHFTYKLAQHASVAFIAAGRTSASGTTRFTRPRLCASAALNHLAPDRSLLRGARSSRHELHWEPSSSGYQVIPNLAARLAAELALETSSAANNAAASSATTGATRCAVSGAAK